jgi:hypothetical protein
MATGEGKHQLEAGLKRAIESISRRRQDEPGAKLGTLIDDACRQFDLSPMQAEFLYRHFSAAAERPEAV